MHQILHKFEFCRINDGDGKLQFSAVFRGFFIFRRLHLYSVQCIIFYNGGEGNLLGNSNANRANDQPSNTIFRKTKLFIDIQ